MSKNSVNTVTIFNRWGDVIKSIENYDNISAYWMVTNTNDQPMPSGTYFFTIEVPSEQVVMATGTNRRKLRNNIYNMRLFKILFYLVVFLLEL